MHSSERMSSWSRPTEIEWPRVWLRFKARDLDSDQLVEYRIQDLPEDRVRDTIEHMKTYLLRDEPMCNSFKLAEDPDALEEYDRMWSDLARQRMALVCFREGSDEIVGQNMLNVVVKGDAKQYKFKSAGARRVYESYVALLKQVDLFEKYGVDKYMSAWGLSVDPKYRGRGIAKELLRARIPMCRAMGFRLTITQFSHPGSQIPAAKVGFFDEIVVSYKELEKRGYVFPGVKHELVKLMAMIVE